MKNSNGVILSDTIEVVDIFPQSPISIIVLHTNAIFGIFFIDSFVDKYKFRTMSCLVLHRAVDLTHQYQTQVNCAIIAQDNSFLQQTSSKSLLRKYRHSVKRKTWKIVWILIMLASSKYYLYSLVTPAIHLTIVIAGQLRERFLALEFFRNAQEWQ